MKRFYTEVGVACADGGFRVLLDGRPLRTPDRRELRLPWRALAEAVAEEWRAQGEEIDPRRMPLTRLATTAVDLLPGRAPAVVEELLDFACHDVLCYRVEHPRELVVRQREAWDPWLDWAARELGVRLAATAGIAAVEQEEAAIERLRALLAEFDPLSLVGLHAAARVTHSIVLALALARGALDADEAFRLAHLEELWEIEQWGEEREQKKRHAALLAELRAAGTLLLASRAGG